jgi:hypothetical protein
LITARRAREIDAHAVLSISERSTANADDGISTTPRAFALAAKSSARHGGGNSSHTKMHAGSWRARIQQAVRP